MKSAHTLLLAFLAIAAASLNAQSFTEQLTDEEFAAAGLDKLSPAELQQLNRLWQAHATDAPPAPPSAPVVNATPLPPIPTAPQPQVRDEDLVGKEQLAYKIVEKAPKKVESRLVGTFEGWFGSTTFTLENGQVWMQRIDDNQKYSPSENPKVTVFKSIGGYRIRFEGYRQTCPVKRIK